MQALVVPQPTPASLLRLIAAGAIVILFGVLRFYLYASTVELPWEARDTFMIVPRTLCSGLTCLACRGVWANLGWSWNKPKLAAAIGAVSVAFALVDIVIRYDRTAWNGLLVFNTLWVVLYEQTLYRGLLLFELRRRWTDRTAIIVSTLVFTVGHVQAQPLWFWPSIVAWGLILAAGRCAGLGLYWLLIIHFVVDTAYMCVYTPGPTSLLYASVPALQLLSAIGICRWIGREHARE